MERHPFKIDACVILPDHFHTVWTLPENDRDYPTRLRLIKGYFTRKLDDQQADLQNTSRKINGEQAVWQRRYWEHMLRDERDFWQHIEYVHTNPVKHGQASSPEEWPYSSFRQYVRNGIYTNDLSEIPTFPVGDGE